MRRRLHQLLIGISAVLSFGLLCLWSWTSAMGDLRWMVAPSLDMSVNIQGCRMEWRRTYAIKGEIPTTQFMAAPIPPQRLIPNVTAVLGFGYSSGHEMGYMNYEPGSDPNRGMVRLADYWILVLPVWALLLPASLPWFSYLVGWYRRARERRKGFVVIGAGADNLPARPASRTAKQN